MRSYLPFLFLFTFLSTIAQQPGMPNAPVQQNVPSNTNDKSSTGETLRFVNDLLNRYNKYDSSIRIDQITGEIIFTDRFSELRAYFSDVEFRRDLENMGIYCKDASNCLRSRDTSSGDPESPRKKYTFGIKENGLAVPDTDIAIQRLNQMLNSFSGTPKPMIPINNVSMGAVNDQLDIINTAFRNYNNYDTVFSVKGNTLHWDSRVANVSAEISDLTFYIDYESRWIVMQCISGECLEGSISKDSYSMGLQTSNGDIAPNIEEVLQAFNTLRKEVLTR